MCTLVLALASCGSGSGERTLFVLLTDNWLLRVSAESDVLTRTPSGRRAGESVAWWAAGRESGSQTIYALVRGSGRHVAAIDAGGAVRAR